MNARCRPQNTLLISQKSYRIRSFAARTHGKHAQSFDFDLHAHEPYSLHFFAIVSGPLLVEPYSPHFFAVIPSGGNVSTVFLLTSAQSVLSAVPLLSV